MSSTSSGRIGFRLSKARTPALKKHATLLEDTIIENSHHFHENNSFDCWMSRHYIIKQTVERIEVTNRPLATLDRNGWW